MIVRLGFRLNNVIQRAAINAGVIAFTSEMATRYSGNLHAACGTAPWINYANLLNPPSSFHPNEGGNLAYALALNDSRILHNAIGDVRVALD